MSSLIDNVPDGLRGQSVTVTPAAAPVLSQSNDRVEAILQNNGANPIFIGFDVSVTTANGWPIPAGGVLVLNTSHEISAIVAAGTEDLRVLETYDK